MRLSVAYLLHSATWFVFVFWFFRYLTEGRGFTVLASGCLGEPAEHRRRGAGAAHRRGSGSLSADESARPAPGAASRWRAC